MKPIVVSLLALAVVVIGAGYAILKYRTVPVEAPVSVTVFTRIARRDLLQDAFNEAVLMRPGQKLTTALVWADYSFIDGLVRAVGFTLGATSQGLRKIQNGYARTYALVMLVGVLALAATIWMVTL